MSDKEQSGYRTPEIANLQVLGTNIDIIIDDNACNANGADGLFTNSSIYLRSVYPSRDRYFVVLFHELTHAVIDELAPQFGIELEEILVNCISKTLGSVTETMVAVYEHIASGDTTDMPLESSEMPCEATETPNIGDDKEETPESLRDPSESHIEPCKDNSLISDRSSRIDALNDIYYGDERRY